VSGQHTIVEAILRDAMRAAAEIGRLMRAEAEIASYAVQQGRERERRTALTRARLVADAILESFFSGKSARDREARLGEMQQYVLAPSPASWAKLEALRDRLHASPIGIASFHWELEFEDVFDRADPGFDAIVGNPPFAGKNTIASGHPLAYPDWLKTLHPGAHGNADLAAHFFRRAFGLLRRGGAFGLIATNTIRQGDTRGTGLARIVAEGGTIYRAVSRHRWEGEAAVVVSMVFVSKGEGTASTVLDDRPVSRISAYLVEGELDGSPLPLRENARKAFEGSKIYGSGFTFDDAGSNAGKASSLSEMARLVAADPRNANLIRPYLGGEELNNSPTHAHRRYVIDFKDRPLRRQSGGESWAASGAAARVEQLRVGVVAVDFPGEVAADWPDLLRIVERTVKPERNRLGESAIDRTRKRLWWRYGSSASQLYQAIHGMPRVLACPITSPHLAFTFLGSEQIFANTVDVFALATNACFASLQSRVHEVWTRFFASTLEERLRYTPSDCFETFPLPPDYADDPQLEAAGQAYHDHRAALMVARDQGMTPTYNRFHNPADTDADITQLRRLHAAMDRAVLAAYGWDDLAERAAPVFLDDTSEADHQYQRRLHWPAPFRDELLARLLRLNEDRARAERML
jgi:hypothetical protein